MRWETRATIIPVLFFFVQQHFSLLQASPSVEPCPSDSLLANGICKCDPERCSKPPCLSILTLSSNGTDTPGDCCPIYSCEGCTNSTLIDGKCPCAPGATITNGKCTCHNPQEKLVGDQCVCDPDLCDLPDLCDDRSVPVIEKRGCCNVTVCKTCPFDSFPVNVNETLIEPKCVCFPCSDKLCKPNETVYVKQRGTDFPGKCCDMYECKPISGLRDCVIGELIYSNGESWIGPDFQDCSCKNGIALCSKPKDDEDKPCHAEGKVYGHNDIWNEEECLKCNCTNGRIVCHADICDNSNHQTISGDEKPCHSDGKLYKHNDTWYEDDCFKCRCSNGKKHCSPDSCDDTTSHSIAKPNCPSLNDCNKKCPDGFKIGKRGCRLCRCNSFWDDLLYKHNFTRNDVQEILEIVDDANLTRNELRDTLQLLDKFNVTTNEMREILEEHSESKIEIAETTTTSTTTTTTTSAPITYAPSKDEPQVVAQDTGPNVIVIVVGVLLIFAALLIALAVKFFNHGKKGNYDTTPPSSSDSLLTCFKTKAEKGPTLLKRNRSSSDDSEANMLKK